MVWKRNYVNGSKLRSSLLLRDLSLHLVDTVRRLAEIRIQAHSLLKIRKRSVEVALPLPCQSAIVIRFMPLWLQAYRLFKVHQRALKVLQAKASGSAEISKFRARRMVLQRCRAVVTQARPIALLRPRQTAHPIGFVLSWLKPNSGRQVIDRFV